MSASGEATYSAPDPVRGDQPDPTRAFIEGWLLVSLGAILVARAESLSSTRTSLVLTQLLGVIFWWLGLRFQLSLASKAWIRRYGRPPELGSLLEKIRQHSENELAAKAIQSEIREDPRTPTDSAIRVSVTSDAVKLEGTVPSQEAKDAANAHARRFADRPERPREVRNRIIIDPALVEA
jgi:hypothetical protein